VLGLDVSAEEVNADDGPTKLAPFGGRELRSWLERISGDGGRICGLCVGARAHNGWSLRRSQRRGLGGRIRYE
jgi:hypothetical protein